MLLPGSLMTVMQIPSYYLKVKKTGRIGIADEPHHDGIHLRLERDLYWYSLNELEPSTEETYLDQIKLIKSARTDEEYKEVLKGI
jgi:hypothetical protein